MITTEQLAALDALAKEATPGNWNAVSADLRIGVRADMG